MVQRAELDLVDDEYGRPTHVDDLAKHLLRLGELISNVEDVPFLLHLGPGHAVSRYGWAGVRKRLPDAGPPCAWRRTGYDSRRRCDRKDASLAAC